MKYFPGNPFEGKAIIPAIKALVDKYAVRPFTVVADAAMISSGNIKELLNHRLKCIVGARLGNLPGDKIEEIDQMLLRKDGHTIRIKTNDGNLICSYSSLCYRKDKYEM